MLFKGIFELEGTWGAGGLITKLNAISSKITFVKYTVLVQI